MRVVFFGDSICVGFGVSVHKTWVTRLSAAIEAEFGERFLMVNSSVNGNTTRMALERMGEDVQRWGVAAMIVQFGLNDCNRWETHGGLPRVNAESFRHNLIEIVARARAYGAMEVILNINHPVLKRRPDGVVDEGYQRDVLHYNQIVREIADSENGVQVADLQTAFEHAAARQLTLADLLLADGVHLSQKGHDVYFETMRSRVLSSLDRISELSAGS